MRELDLNIEIKRIGQFIQEFLRSTGFSKVVIGLSGGVDSAVSAALAVNALGSENVFAVMMPYKTSHPDSLADAVHLAKQLGISYSIVDITPMTDAYFTTYEKDAETLRKGNWMARMRMSVLYDLSAKLDALVFGTSNRTELMVGYCTQYGDSACAFEPIGHLYKTEVWKMAKILNIPESIISKTPTADLWVGQSDEADLGMTYNELDQIVSALTEMDIDFRSSENLDFPQEQYRKVDKMIQNSAFKRRMPPCPERNYAPE